MIEYQLLEGMPSGDSLVHLNQINQEVFGSGNIHIDLANELQGKQKIFLCLAFKEGVPVGFKLGYKERPHYFESWLGGVSNSARRQGIAQELMRRQHEWCREQGFRIVTTIADNQNVAMLILNLQNGFELVGTMLDRGKHMKLFLQKWLV